MMMKMMEMMLTVELLQSIGSRNGRTALSTKRRNELDCLKRLLLLSSE
jgi:hypothetical protein